MPAKDIVVEKLKGSPQLFSTGFPEGRTPRRSPPWRVNTETAKSVLGHSWNSCSFTYAFLQRLLRPLSV
ncbi:hypothetical protein EVAR_45748_1 [Eumeta japonica]|uniref:Uncharacterized protein n=1 Tax=Eumeta variegata TaxID=151549 RepID=A0A4C1YRM7_EUMVA|nr:hypothetical protein EVAR_45748_1 [Eumeta japonica]